MVFVNNSSYISKELDYGKIHPLIYLSKCVVTLILKVFA